MSNWNPGQYLKFKEERTQPAIDLVARIKIDTPKTIIDIGCGPGNSTQILYKKWPSADILGIDTSVQMIDKARKDHPEQKWAVADASSFDADRAFDVVFSNAALQWIPNHEVLIPNLFKLVSGKGALAVQVPANSESPFHRALAAVAADKKWRDYTKGSHKILNYQSAPYYYALLQSIAAEIDLWKTIYYHRLESHYEIIEWYKATGMRPYLDSLPDEEKRSMFENEVLEKCKENYNVQKDGKILLPFKRIFFVAYK
jgi:trans-aconitate 2-methyltransferase